jgi:dolichol-phosphate mannosyltransferase
MTATLSAPPRLLSVVIPAHNEEASIRPVLRALCMELQTAGIAYEIVVANDHSADDTRGAVMEVAREFPAVRCVDNPREGGFGLAVRAGLDAFAGDAVAIVMADGSDPPQDVVRCFRELQKGYDCVFGSRFMSGSVVIDYPGFKLGINRLANLFIKLLFRIPLNDTTNAFKVYRRETIDGLRPLLSNHFNLTVELPLKAIVRGFSYSVIPIGWRNRTEGLSKLKLQEMGSRYLFIVLYALLEKHLAKGDYRRPLAASRSRAHEQELLPEEPPRQG